MNSQILKSDESVAMQILLLFLNCRVCLLATPFPTMNITTG